VVCYGGAQFTFKSFCENSNSHNCHIGMASFRHELLVSVLLLKCGRMHQLNTFSLTAKAVKSEEKSVQLSKGAFINDFLRNPHFSVCFGQNYLCEDGYQRLQKSIHNSRIRCYTTSVLIVYFLANSTLTI
jgi:hypothetical protein